MSQLTKVCLLMAVVLAGGQTAAAQSPWIRHVIDNSLRGTDGVRLADSNHDGLPDITTGWEESGTIRLYLHPGVASVERKKGGRTEGHELRFAGQRHCTQALLGITGRLPSGFRSYS